MHERQAATVPRSHRPPRPCLAVPSPLPPPLLLLLLLLLQAPGICFAAGTVTSAPTPPVLSRAFAATISSEGSGGGGTFVTADEDHPSPAVRGYLTSDPSVACAVAWASIVQACGAQQQINCSEAMSQNGGSTDNTACTDYLACISKEGGFPCTMTSSASVEGQSGTAYSIEGFAPGCSSSDIGDIWKKVFKAAKATLPSGDSMGGCHFTCQSPGPAGSKSCSGLGGGAIAGIVIASLCGVALFAGGFWHYNKRRQSPSQRDSTGSAYGTLG